MLDNLNHREFHFASQLRKYCQSFAAKQRNNRHANENKTEDPVDSRRYIIPYNLPTIVFLLHGKQSSTQSVVGQPVQRSAIEAIMSEIDHSSDFEDESKARYLIVDHSHLLQMFATRVDSIMGTVDLACRSKYSPRHPNYLRL
jgi:hypothetical protein